jgi:excisionase family DNA binding protein
MTVDQAAEFLGLSSHGVVELIASGQLTWTMAANRKE